MSGEDDEGGGAGGKERPDRLFRQHLDPSGTGAGALNWRPGIEDLDDVPFDGVGLWRPIGPEPVDIAHAQLTAGIGPNSGEVLDIAIDASGAGAPTLYIATNDGGVWKSSNGGLSWTPLTDMLPTESIGAVAIDPGDPNIVYAGSGNLFEGGGNIPKAMGVWRSHDGGATWAPLDGGPDATAMNEGTVRIVCPAPNVVLVAGANALFLSVDAGAHFGANPPRFDDSIPIKSGFITALEVDTAFRAVRLVEEATVTTPIVVRCAKHGFRKDDRVSVGGVAPNTGGGANGTWSVEPGNDDDHFVLVGSVGTGGGSPSTTGVVIGPRRPNTLTISGVTIAPATRVITVNVAAHGLITGDIVAINGVGGVVAANGSWSVRVIDDDHFELVGTKAAANAAYTSGGIVDAPPHDAPKPITLAANVAAIGIELTVTAHGLADGDQVAVRGLPGINAPANVGVVRRVDDDRLRVSGLKMSSPNFSGTGATVHGPSAAWNMAYFAIAGRAHENPTLERDRGLYRLCLTSDGGLALSDNLLSHPGGFTKEYNQVRFAQSMLPRPGTLYAAIQEKKEEGKAHLVAVLRSDDFGAHWTNAPTAPLLASLAKDGTGQSDYVFTLGVDPRDRRRVYLGMDQLWRSEDGGASWPSTAMETGGGDLHALLGGFGQSVSTGKLHFDHHEIVFLPATFWAFAGGTLAPPPTPVYFGTDGGIARSDDAGVTYVGLNESLSTSLLFSIDMGRGAGNTDFTFAGTQDEGTLGHRPSDPDRMWSEGLGGDGWQVAVDPFDATVVYAIKNGFLARTTDGGDNWFTAGDPATVIVRSVSNTDPVHFETLSHPFEDGDAVKVSGVRSNGTLVSAVNGTRKIKFVNDHAFELVGVNGSTLPPFDTAPTAQGDRFLPRRSITNVARTKPIEITVSGPHGLHSGDVVHVEGVQGVVSANNTAQQPTWVVAEVPNEPTKVTLNGSDGTADPPYLPRTGRLRPLATSDLVPVVLATNANPIVVTAPQHGFVTGQTVSIRGVRGNLAANVVNARITVIDSNSFRLDGVQGSGAYGDGPVVSGDSVGRKLPRTNRFERQRIAVVPNATRRADTVFMSIKNDLFRSEDSGRLFKRVRRFDQEITAIAIPDAARLWVGLAGAERKGKRLAVPGTVQFSNDLGEHWFTAAKNKFVADVGAVGAISAIAVHPGFPNFVAVVTSGYTEIHQRMRTRHAFLSRTEGIDDGTAPAWIEIGGVVDDHPMTSTGDDSSTNLPDLPFHSAAFLTGSADPFELLLACDGGVLRGTPNPDSFLFIWKRIGPNLPIVSCQQLVVDASDPIKPIVRLATYGRSAWELEKPSGPRLVLRGSLGFGEQTQSLTAKLPFRLHNAGDADLQATLLLDTSGAFRMTSFSGVQTISPGGSLPVDVEFTPAALGLQTGSFTILTDDPLNGNVIVRASGIGVAPGQARLAVRAVNLRFGPVLVGTTAKLPFAVTNRGTGDATITNVTVTGSATITVVPATHFPLSATEREIIDVEFTPTTKGVVQATITITNTGAGTLVIDVTGEGTTVAARVLSSVLNSLGLAPAPAIA